jgi:hypothetical protein
MVFNQVNEVFAMPRNLKLYLRSLVHAPVYGIPEENDQKKDNNAGRSGNSASTQ